METTHQDSLLTTTEFIWERAKPLSMPHAEPCANSNITGLTGSSFTGRTVILSQNKRLAFWLVLWGSGFSMRVELCTCLKKKSRFVDLPLPMARCRNTPNQERSDFKLSG